MKVLVYIIVMGTLIAIFCLGFRMGHHSSEESFEGKVVLAARLAAESLRDKGYRLVKLYPEINKPNPVADVMDWDSGVDLIHILSTQDPPPPLKDKQLRLCLYDEKLTISCGEQVDMDKTSKVFFDEILKPMVDMYIRERLQGPTKQIKGKWHDREITKAKEE